jgi:hypothetical protein
MINEGLTAPDAELYPIKTMGGEVQVPTQASFTVEVLDTAARAIF